MIEWGCISYDKRGGNGEKYMVFELQDEGGATVGAYDLLTDAKINMETERSRRKNILTDIQRETEILFRWGLKMLELVRSFKYLVRVMDKSDNYWTKICANIRKAGNIWGIFYTYLSSVLYIWWWILYYYMGMRHELY